MAAIGTGTYTIQNVMHRAFVSQNEEHALVADVYGYSDSGSSTENLGNRVMLWIITRHRNDKYTIQNAETYKFAGCTSLPEIDEVVDAKRFRKQWVIKETSVKGRYVIFTTSSHTDLFWGFNDDELSTPVSLRHVPNHPSNQWTFEKVSQNDPSEEQERLRAKLITSEEKCAELMEEVALLQAEAKQHAAIEANLRQELDLSQQAEETRRLENAEKWELREKEMNDTMSRATAAAVREERIRFAAKYKREEAKWKMREKELTDDLNRAATYVTQMQSGKYIPKSSQVWRV